MSICLLLSKDATLPAGIEGGLSLLSPSPTLLALDHDQDLDGVLKSLTDVKLLLVDLRHFAPPTDCDIPMVVLDDESSPPIPQPHPCILIPLRSAELSSLIQYLLNNGNGDGKFGEWNPLSFFLRVQREVLHDLNNQQTTIQGHLPLLADTCQGEEHEILKDIQGAAAHAARLIKRLEAMNPDAPCELNTIPLPPFLKTLSGISRRVLGRSVQVDVQYPEDDTAITADEALLSLCLLTGLDVCASAQHPCTLRTIPEGKRLHIRIQGSLSMDEVDTTLLTQLNQRLHPMGATVHVDHDGLDYTVKTAHPPPAS